MSLSLTSWIKAAMKTRVGSVFSWVIDGGQRERDKHKQCWHKGESGWKHGTLFLWWGREKGRELVQILFQSAAAAFFGKQDTHLVLKKRAEKLPKPQWALSTVSIGNTNVESLVLFSLHASPDSFNPMTLCVAQSGSEAPLQLNIISRSPFGMFVYGMGSSVSTVL